MARLTVTIMALAVVLSACSSSGESDLESGSPPGTEQTSPPSTDMDRSEPFEEHAVRVIDWYNQREDLVQACMVGEGFEYHPEYVPSSEKDALTESGATDLESTGPQRLIPPEPRALLDAERRSRELVGYAVFFGQQEVEAAQDDLRQLLPESSGTASAGGNVSPAVEQNRKYVDSLPEDAREEYWLALYGEQDPEASSDSADSSCYAKAQEAIGARPVRMNLDLNRFLEAEERVLGLVESDPRVVEAAQGYTRCMAEEGYSVGDPLEAYAVMAARSDELIGELEAAGVDLGPLFKNGAWSEVLPADRLHELQSEEIAVALFDWDCAQDVREVRESVTEEIEREVLLTDYRDVAIDLGIEL